MLLDALGHRRGRKELCDAGRAIEGAVDAVLANRANWTADLGGKTGTRAFGAAVVAELEKSATRIAQTV
jgi:3-isopropylmalate dehydrogenase